ncbi:MAG: hypothetical protein ACO1O6_15215 [Bacteroidota bacterium]
MVSTPDKFRIIHTEKIKDIAQVLRYKNGILEVKWDDSLEEITLDHMKQLIARIREMGAGKKMCVYMSVNEFVTITIDALNYAASKECSEVTQANAVLVDNLAKKLVFNFYLRVNKPTTLTKTFSTKDEAFDWLISLLN